MMTRFFMGMMSVVFLMSCVTYADYIDPSEVVLNENVDHLPYKFRSQQYQETEEDTEMLAKIEALLEQKTCFEMLEIKKKLTSTMHRLEIKGTYETRVVVLEQNGELLGVPITYNGDSVESGMNRGDEYLESGQGYIDETSGFQFVYNIFDNQIEYILHKVYDMIIEESYVSAAGDETIPIDESLDFEIHNSCETIRLPIMGGHFPMWYELAEK